jgi:hypothetical protein
MTPALAVGVGTPSGVRPTRAQPERNPKKLRLNEQYWNMTPYFTLTPYFTPYFRISYSQITMQPLDAITEKDAVRRYVEINPVSQLYLTNATQAKNHVVNREHC